MCFVGDIIKEHADREFDTGIERVIWLSEKEIREHTRVRSLLVLKSIEDYIAGNKFPLTLIQDVL